MAKFCLRRPGIAPPAAQLVRGGGGPGERQVVNIVVLTIVLRFIDVYFVNEKVGDLPAPLSPEIHLSPPGSGWYLSCAVFRTPTGRPIELGVGAELSSHICVCLSGQISVLYISLVGDCTGGILIVINV